MHSSTDDPRKVCKVSPYLCKKSIVALFYDRRCCEVSLLGLDEACSFKIMDERISRDGDAQCGASEIAMNAVYH